MKYLMRLDDKPYDLIKSGKKSIEVRINDEKRQKLQLGDTLEFSKRSNMDEKLNVEVIGLLKYKSFEDLAKDFSMDYFGYPKDYSLDKFLEGNYSCYSKEQEEKYGVLGIKIK